MSKINIVKPVITQHIDHEFVSRENNNLSNLLTRWCTDSISLAFAAIIFHNTIAQMAHRAYGKYNAECGIEMKQLVNGCIDRCNGFFNAAKMFSNTCAGDFWTISHIVR